MYFEIYILFILQKQKTQSLILNNRYTILFLMIMLEDKSLNYEIVTVFETYMNNLDNSISVKPVLESHIEIYSKALNKLVKIASNTKLIPFLIIVYQLKGVKDALVKIQKLKKKF